MDSDIEELVDSVAKTFNINIPNEDAEQLATVGGMYGYVWEHVKDRKIAQCTTQQLFYRLRCSMKKVTAFAGEIAPSTALEEVIPAADRKAIWKTVAKEAELEIPGLVFPDGVYQFLFWSGVILVLAGIITGFCFSSFGIGALAVTIGGGITWLLSIVFTPWKTAFADRNMSALTITTLRLNSSQFMGNGLTRHEVEALIDNIIIDKTGISPDKISPEKLFTTDLKIY